MEGGGSDPHSTSVSSLGEVDDVALQRLVFDMHQELEHLDIKRSKIFSRGVLARLDKLVVRTPIYQEHKMKMSEQERLKAEKARQDKEERERKRKENEEREREKMQKIKEKEEREREKAEEEKKEREKKERLIREEKERLLKESKRKMIDEQRERERAAREKEAELKAAERARLAAEAKERERKEREIRETKIQKEKEEKRRLEEELRRKEKERLDAERKRKEEERKKAEAEKEALQRKEREAREAREKAAKEEVERREKELEEKQKLWDERRRKKEEEEKARREKAQEMIVQKERANREALEKKAAEEKERMAKDQELKAADRQAALEARAAAAAVRRDADRAAREQKQMEARTRREKADVRPARKPAVPPASPSTSRDDPQAKAKTPSTKTPVSARPSTGKVTPKQPAQTRPKTSPAAPNAKAIPAPDASAKSPEPKTPTPHDASSTPKVLKGRKKAGDGAVSDLQKLLVEWDAKAESNAAEVIAAVEARIGQLASVDEDAVAKHAGDIAAAEKDFSIILKLKSPPSSTQEVIISLSAMLRGTSLDYKSSVGILKEWDDTTAAVQAFDGTKVSRETYEYVDRVARTMDEDKLQRASPCAVPVLHWIRAVLPKVEKGLLGDMLSGYQRKAVKTPPEVQSATPASPKSPSANRKGESTAPVSELQKLLVEWDAKAESDAAEVIAAVEARIGQLASVDEDAVAKHAGDIAAAEKDFSFIRKLARPPSSTQEVIISMSAMLRGTGLDYKSSVGILKEWDDITAAVQAFDGTKVSRETYEYVDRVARTMDEDKLQRASPCAVPVLHWIQAVLPKVEKGLLGDMLSGYKGNLKSEDAACDTDGAEEPAAATKSLPSPFDGLPSSVTDEFSKKCDPEALRELETTDGDLATRKGAMENCVHVLSDYFEQMSIEDKDAIADSLVQLFDSNMPDFLKHKRPPPHICQLIEAAGHLVGGKANYFEAIRYLLGDWESTMSTLRGFDGTGVAKDAVDKCQLLFSQHTEEDMDRDVTKAGALLRWLKLVMPLCERELVQECLRTAASAIGLEEGGDDKDAPYEEYAEA